MIIEIKTNHTANLFQLCVCVGGVDIASLILWRFSHPDPTSDVFIDTQRIIVIECIHVQRYSEYAKCLKCLLSRLRTILVIQKCEQNKSGLDQSMVAPTIGQVIDCKIQCSYIELARKVMLQVQFPTTPIPGPHPAITLITVFRTRFIWQVAGNVECELM